MLVIHDEQLTRQLTEIANQEHRPVEDVLKSLVAQYIRQDVAETQPGSSARFAEISRTMAFETENPIDPQQADPILDAEFADYLLKRMQDGSASNSDG